jgi:hypothetical protein
MAEEIQINIKGQCPHRIAKYNPRLPITTAVAEILTKGLMPRDAHTMPAV